ncbi:hypothetical protein OsJ_35387 [Oryza sativa Japonica Group]|uniref:rRNA N-glycosylase n=2 Tax=Oryza sativa subsp. japonica TaxID=39947 RepID=B9GC41_ORYSJ|nr:hypothetical protein OsJ_35387 [Oryza sativa Japonica Group]
MLLIQLREDTRRRLNSIRERDQERAGQNTFHGVAITSLNKQWRRINLVHQDRPTVSLLIDESNGYLVRFRKGNGTWMHFNDQELPNVPGTEQRVPGIPIQLSSSYMNLIKDNERPYFSVGRQSLRHSYFVLLNYDAEVDLRSAMMKRQRKALTQLIILFCEAARIRPVLEFISEAMSTEDTTPLDETLWTWIKNWSTLSRFALHCRRCERDATPLDPNEIKHVSPYGITSREQVLESLRHSYFVLLNYDAEVDLRSAMMKRQRKALTQLIILFCEAARIRPVLEFISEAMSTEDTTPLDETLWTWIKNWSTLSRFALHCRRCERDATPLDPNEIKHVSPYGITSREQVLEVLLLILSRPLSQP